MGQIVSGYLDFAERQAERQKAMTMKDWATHLDNILTMSGENCSKVQARYRTKKPSTMPHKNTKSTSNAH